MRIPRKLRQLSIKRPVVERAMGVWVLAVLLFFLWEIMQYTGLYASLAEWEFARFGQYAPLLTFALLVLLFSSPALLLLRSRHQRDMPQYAQCSSRQAAYSSAVHFRQSLFVLAAVLFTAATVVAIVAITRTIDRNSTRIILPDPAQVRSVDTGAATLRGKIMFDRTAAFAQNLLVVKRGVRFAPIIAPNPTEGVPVIAYFVELDQHDSVWQGRHNGIEDRSGTLVRNGLPGAIERLYRYAGLRTSRPYYVLYRSIEARRAPFWITSLQLFLAGVIVIIAGLLQARHIKRAFPSEQLASSDPENKKVS